MSSKMGTSSEELTVAVFAKAPRSGRVKTRLAGDIGSEDATELYRRFLSDVAETVAGLDEALERPTHAVLAHTGEPMHEDFEPFRRHDFEFVEQTGPTLGARLVDVLERHYAERKGPLIFIGTDSPTLGARHFAAACKELAEAEVVIGPSFDGGYYMIGLSGLYRSVFEEIDWSTPRVFGQTLRRCRESSLLCEALEFWYDVDTFDDLKLLKTHLFDYLQKGQPQLAASTAAYLEELERRGLFESAD